MALIPTPEDQAIQDQMTADNAAQNPAGTAALGAAPVSAVPAASPAIGSNSTPTQAADAALSLRLNQPAPGSFGSKLSEALDQTPLELKPNGKPAPGSWSRSLVGAAQVALSGLGDAGAIGKVPPGAGALYGVAKTLQAGNQRNAENLAEKHKEAIQDEEQRRANEQEADRQKKVKLDTAAANKQQMSQEKLAYELKVDDPLIAQGQGVVKLLTDPSSGHAVQPAATGVTWDQMQQGVIDGKWNTTNFTPYPVKKEVIGADDNGDPIYRKLYTILPNGGPVTLTDKDADTIKFINENLGAGDQQVKIGQKFDNTTQFNTLYQNASNNWTALQAKKKALLDAGVVDQEEANKLSATAVSGDILQAMARHPNDIMAAYDEITQRAANDPAFAKRAGNIPNDFRSYMNQGGKSDVFDKLLEKRLETTSTSLDALTEYEKNPDKYSGENANSAMARAKQEIDDPNVKADVKARWQKVYDSAHTAHMLTEDDKKSEKNAGKLDYSGDTKLTGQAFLNSMPDERARALVQQAGEGSLGLKNMAIVVARNPEFIGDVALAYPNFKQDKASAMLDVYKDFESGKTANTILSIDAALQHMKDLAELTTPEAFVPKSPAYARRLAAMNTGAEEMARYYANGNQPSKEEIIAAKDTLAASLGATQESWTAGIRQNAQQMAQKMGSLRNRWVSAMPSPQFAANNPMPNLSDDAREAAQKLGVDIDRVVANPNAAVTSATTPKPNLPPVPTGSTRLFANGHYYDIPTANVAAAQKAHPELKAAQ